MVDHIAENLSLAKQKTNKIQNSSSEIMGKRGTNMSLSILNKSCTYFDQKMFLNHATDILVSYVVLEMHFISSSSLKFCIDKTTTTQLYSV